ncbi:MAG: glucose-6-phosphate isomerase [Gammaproteobacteria bacterium]|nr:glucose-6-phosphate isomerase [Gammaproteobacteria bacterium]MCD8542863.1 glucose-6-phosphate isomerase [Gammaproteobacteria bacterium]
MESIALTPTWKVLQQHKLDLSRVHMRDLFLNDPQRFERFSAKHDGFLLDFSKNRLTQSTLLLLLQLAETAEVKLRSFEMFSGEKINITERRAALHSALRNMSQAPVFLDHHNIMQDITLVWRHIEKISQSIRRRECFGFSGQPINTIVNLGIGGSDLGPKMVTYALEHLAHDDLACYFVSNIDATHLTRVLKKCNPETTLFIISSKSFTTVETLENAKFAKEWLLKHTTNKALKKHFIAITEQTTKALQWGISPDYILPIWDWVGGRYSLWSAIGLPIAIMFGMSVFRELLSGAHAMDDHFKNAELAHNLPVLLALMGVWNHNFFHMPSYAVLPYCEALRYFPEHLQQVEMESNGKSVDVLGRDILDYQTAPVVWGAIGTNGQHSFHQLLHQGTAKVFCDFILPIHPIDVVDQHHDLLVSNCFAQSQALMQGTSLGNIYEELLAQGMEPDAAAALSEHKMNVGNKPSNTLLFPQLTPYYLGALIALYEHKVFTQGVIWQVNSFDQWGVEQGKILANHLMPAVKEGISLSGLDGSTRYLIDYYVKSKKLSILN